MVIRQRIKMFFLSWKQSSKEKVVQALRNIIEICHNLKIPEQVWIPDKEESSFLMMAAAEAIIRGGKKY